MMLKRFLAEQRDVIVMCVNSTEDQIADCIKSIITINFKDIYGDDV